MPVTVVVRSSASGEARLTFDGTQRIVLGRGAGCDLRLPDATVSLRHASLRAQGADFVVLDEGSANGTYVGDVRVAPHTSRIVRSGDLVRLGRVWIELRVDRSPVTRDLAAATTRTSRLRARLREAMGAMGSDRTVKLQITEGQDQGETLELTEEGRAYVLGRGPECDLPLEDADASREHVRVVRRGITVLLRDLDTKNGTWLGQTRVAQDRDVPWKPGHVLQIGHTTIALQEPVGETLAEIEAAPDEVLPPGAVVAPPPATTATRAPARATGRARLSEPPSPPSTAPVVVRGGTMRRRPLACRACAPALLAPTGWTPHRSHRHGRRDRRPRPQHRGALLAAARVTLHVCAPCPAVSAGGTPVIPGIVRAFGSLAGFLFDGARSRLCARWVGLRQALEGNGPPASARAPRRSGVARSGASSGTSHHRRIERLGDGQVRPARAHGRRDLALVQVEELAPVRRHDGQLARQRLVHHDAGGAHR